MTRWLVTGAGGMLGCDLVSMLRDQDADVTALTRRDLDITDPAAVAAAVQRGRPDVVRRAAVGDGLPLMVIQLVGREARHMADRAATPDEEAAAERGDEEVDADAEDVAAHYEEMTDLGAHVKGEGEID